MKFNNQSEEFVIYLDGEIDHCRAELLRDVVDKTLAEISGKRVVFDMRGVEFMDSSGIGFLIGRYKYAIAHGCIVSVRNSAPHVDKVLEMAGIYKIIRKE